jgi:hypothetical protein
VFADVDNSMTIAREEIFGPVLAMIPFDSEQQAVDIANDTPYGLAAYVQSADQDRARRVAGSLRAGNVHINGTSLSDGSPFGGYKQSGNGREGGKWGLHGVPRGQGDQRLVGRGTGVAPPVARRGCSATLLGFRRHPSLCWHDDVRVGRRALRGESFMSLSKAQEKRMLTADEFETVSRTHFPEIRDLTRKDLSDLVRRLRDHRDKARDVARQQRREMRGKAEPRGARRLPTTPARR